MGASSEALNAALSLGWGDTLFQYVPVGGRFRLYKSGEVFRKTAIGGWYREDKDNGRKYRTGVRTAVFSIEEQKQNGKAE